MQKNKEELEEKLRNYEAKIRQHFNRTWNEESHSRL